MLDFFKKTWVQIVAGVAVVIGALVLILGGVSAADIGQIPTLVAGIVDAIGVLIIFIKKLIEKKESK